MHNIRSCILQQKDNLNSVIKIMTSVKSLVLQNVSNLVDYESMNYRLLKSQELYKQRKLLQPTDTLKVNAKREKKKKDKKGSSSNSPSSKK